ncbi:hypothetical protein GYA27_01435 [candidate division WWE3 bacterium]|uniref:Uncharacterized protein n=1 Tax=candidate division WWE3 bacterium TaxID=2053526 RepID=A0A7X9DKH0_UNCKA|nr:hypothetical protein [candidate division WWE3 bacterium]
MYLIDKTKAKNILISEGYQEQDINLLLEDYPELYDDLGSVIDIWLNTKNFVDFTYEGISLSQIMNTRGEHIITAAKTMNRLLNPNLSPEEKTRLINSLSHSVTFS